MCGVNCGLIVTLVQRRYAGDALGLAPPATACGLRTSLVSRVLRCGDVTCAGETVEPRICRAEAGLWALGVVGHERD